jgi:hypothetical protein
VFPFDGNLIAIYLQDHLAGAMAGLELARRARDKNEGTELGDFLGRIADDLAEDRASLQQVMDRLGIGADRLKVATAWAVEKVGRLKLNGRLFTYSPLSRIVELEGLITGVNGKLAMWRALRDLAEHDDRLDAAELDRLIARAQDQENGLREHHRLVAVDALTT